MKRRAALQLCVALFLGTLFGCASTAVPAPSEPPRPAITLEAGEGPPLLMWRFFKDPARPSYVLALPEGTGRDTPLIPARAIDALKESEALVHSDLLPGRAIDPKLGQEIFSSRGTAADGKELSDLLSKNAHDELSRRVGNLLPMLERMRPWVVAALLEAQVAEAARLEPAFGTLLRRAGSHPPSASPDIAQDLAYTLLETLSYLEITEEIAFLDESMARIKRNPAVPPELEAAWLAGDLEKTWALELERQDADGPEHVKLSTLMRKQSRFMVKKATLETEPKARVFVAVPLGVVTDDDGLLAALLQAGYTVEQLRAGRE